MTLPAVDPQGPFSATSDYNVIAWVIAQKLSTVQTLTVAQVVAVHGGGVAPVGTVDIRVMVNLMTGAGTAVPHEVIYGVPYVRIQGGANALIVDPEPGDMGLCGFASRDISAVKRARAQANPGSNRKFDWADGIWIGGMLNGTPTQYLQMLGGSIALQSPSVSTSGNLSAGTGYTGTFSTPTGQTVDVQNGIITNVF